MITVMYFLKGLCSTLSAFLNICCQGGFSYSVTMEIFMEYALNNQANHSVICSAGNNYLATN